MPAAGPASSYGSSGGVAVASTGQARGSSEWIVAWIVLATILVAVLVFEAWQVLSGGQADPADAQPVVQEFFATSECAAGRDLVTEASRASFDADCIDGAPDGEPVVEVLSQSGSVVVARVTASFEGDDHGWTVTVIHEGGEWRLDTAVDDESGPWFCPECAAD
jgi:hypothetical protein